MKFDIGEKLYCFHGTGNVRNTLSHNVRKARPIPFKIGNHLFFSLMRTFSLLLFPWYSLFGGMVCS